MLLKRAIRIILALNLLLFSGVTGPAVADSDGASKIIGDIQIYMGILPAEMIRGHLQGHPENSMHGGQPKASHDYHIVIALFDVRDGRRITGADVTARVSDVNITASQKKLNPMLIAGTETYGNYFEMLGEGPFRISLTIHVPDQPEDIEVDFEHGHQ